MIRYFLRATRAQLKGGPLLFALSLFGVALGVASVVSIQIINLNALGAFRGSMQAVSGDADLTLVGTMPVLSEEVYPDVLATPGVAAAWPLYRIDVALVEDEAKEQRKLESAGLVGGRVFLEVIGVDFFTPIEIPWDGEPVDVSDALGRPGWVAVTPTLARDMGWTVGDVVRVSVGTSEVELVIGALSDFQKATPLASPKLAVMDIAQAQSLLGTAGEIHQIDVRIEDDAELERVVSALRAELGPGVQILTPEQREDQAADLLSAFRLNLTALSLISLFVGGFLVYSSTQAALVRRRTEFGLLRSLGATHRQVFGLLVGDVAVLGLGGVALGMPLGFLGAQANVDRVSATVSNLYLLEEIHRLEVPPWFYVLGAVVGLLGAAIGALLPALELGRKDTRALLAAFSLHERVGERAFSMFLGGVSLVVLAGATYLLVGDRWKPAGFLQAFLLIASMPLTAPWLVQRATGLLRVSSFGLAYGAKGLGRQLQTTPIAVAALAIAVSMVVGVTTMVSSFRETLEVWMGSTIQADVYVTTPSWQRAGREASLGPAVLEVFENHPDVLYIDRLRQFFAYSEGRRFSLAAVDASLPADTGRFRFLSGDAGALSSGAILLGEPLARRQGLGVGDRFLIDGRDGPVILPVAGIFYDYSGELGSAFVDLETMREHFGDGPVNNVALYLESGANTDAVVDDLRSRLTDTPLELRSNRRLREQAMDVFDQTFAITRLLRYMSLLIAVCGVALTLIVLARERSAELALYRALGASRLQIFRIYLGKGLGMGLAGVGLGTVVGVLFALVLIYVVNRAFFGWTISIYWPVAGLAGQSLIILAASSIASVYPALIASRTPATELRREDL